MRIRGTVLLLVVLVAPMSCSLPPKHRTPDCVGEIVISSHPPVASVYLDTICIGKTNVHLFRLPCGVNTLKFVKGDVVVTREVTIVGGKNALLTVRLDGKESRFP